MLKVGGLEVSPLCLGGNVFGWTADEACSFEILDAFVDAGGNFIDTADLYAAWGEGHGGESETILGRWMAARKNRDRIVIATKVAKWSRQPGLSAKNIREASEGSRSRLGIDRIDLYYAHEDDATTPIEETMRAFDALVREGKVRELGASNFGAARLAEALAISKREGLASYVAVQPYYNLVHRRDYEGELAPLCVKESIACMPYFALALGFLTGKYRDGKTVESVRKDRASKYLTPAGNGVLAALDVIAAARGTTVAAVALAWLRARPAVTAPIASARTKAQLADLVPMMTLSLAAEEIARLDAASALVNE